MNDPWDVGVKQETAARPPWSVTVQNDDGRDSTESKSRPREARLDRIARRAHQIYEARGGQNGTALEDWLQAEREIDAEEEPAP